MLLPCLAKTANAGVHGKDCDCVECHNAEAPQVACLGVEHQTKLRRRTALIGLLHPLENVHAERAIHLQVVPEPVNEWQHIRSSNGGEPFNLLEAFYKDPSRFAYTFQNYVFVTRLMQV